MTFKNYRIVTNGEEFRIEGLYENTKSFQWIPLSIGYIGCESFGYRPNGNSLTFNSKQECIDFIKITYGTDGVSKIIKTWVPC